MNCNGTSASLVFAGVLFSYFPTISVYFCKKNNTVQYFKLILLKLILNKPHLLVLSVPVTSTVLLCHTLSSVFVTVCVFQSLSISGTFARAVVALASASTTAKEAHARAAAAPPSFNITALEANARAAAARPSVSITASRSGARTVLLRPQAHHDVKS